MKITSSALRWTRLITLGGALLLAAVTWAQETTGAITGAVVDATGAHIPGAAVKIEGKTFSRTVMTDQSGLFRVLQVPPGSYKVSVSANSFSASVAENIEVILGKTTAVEFTLKVGSVQETVNVSADEVGRIDPADNKIQTNITSRLIEALPKGTNFASILRVSPATRPEPASGGFQVDGASGSENSFVIDGQEVSNFRTGVLNGNNNLSLELVQEVQVKTSGFEAEFGGATGGVVNVVTKSGGNTVHGSAGYQFDPGRWWAAPRPFLNSFRAGTGANFVQINEYLKPDKDRFTNHYPFATLGGPLVRDRIWFFASYAPNIYHASRTTKYFSADPRTRTLTASEPARNNSQNEYTFGRLDATPFKSLRMSGAYTWNPISIDGIFPTLASTGNISIGGAPPVVNFGGNLGTLRGAQLTDRQGGRQNANNVTAQVVWTPTSNLVASFRFARGFLNQKPTSYFVPNTTRFRCLGQQGPTEAGCSLGFDTLPTGNNVVNYDVSVRTTFEGDASYQLNQLAGRHELKGGYQNSRISNAVDSGFVNTGLIDLFYGTPITNLTPVAVAASPNALGAGRLTRFGTFGAAQNQAHSIYVQDRWQPAARLSLNLGVRLEKEDLPSFNGFAPPISFGWGDKVVPRLGAAFDLKGDGRSKLFVSFGRFTDRLKFELPRGSFGGDVFYRDYFEILPGSPRFDSYTLARIAGSNPLTPGGQCPITNSNGLSRCQVDLRVASNLPTATIFSGKVDPALQPFRQTEFTAGFERELSRQFLLSVRYSHKNVDSAIEDAGFPTPAGSEAYIIGNPGSGLHAQVAQQFGYAKVAQPQRRYDALEVRLDRRMTRSFFYNVAYTYSRLYGNYSGLASSDEAGRTSPGVNRFFDLPFVGFTAGGQPDNGRLATDRPHVFNAFGAYNFNWFGKAKRQGTEFSFFTTAQSGTPVTSFFSFYGVASILNGRGDLGRTNILTQTDFAIRHSIKLGEGRTLAFDFNALNLFNEANVLGNATSVMGGATDTNATNLGLGVASEQAAINLLLNSGIQNQVSAFLNATANPERRNTAVGMANIFQSGRSVRLGVRFTF